MGISTEEPMVEVSLEPPYKASAIKMSDSLLNIRWHTEKHTQKFQKPNKSPIERFTSSTETGEADIRE